MLVKPRHHLKIFGNAIEPCLTKNASTYDLGIEKEPSSGMVFERANYNIKMIETSNSCEMTNSKGGLYGVSSENNCRRHLMLAIDYFM